MQENFIGLSIIAAFAWFVTKQESKGKVQDSILYIGIAAALAVFFYHQINWNEHERNTIYTRKYRKNSERFENSNEKTFKNNPSRNEPKNYYQE